MATARMGVGTNRDTIGRDQGILDYLDDGHDHHRCAMGGVAVSPERLSPEAQEVRSKDLRRIRWAYIILAVTTAIALYFVGDLFIKEKHARQDAIAASERANAQVRFQTFILCRAEGRTVKQCKNISQDIILPEHVQLDELEAQLARIGEARVNKLFVGPPGAQGKVGPGGAIGPAGPTGRAGARGTPGPKGQQGPQGSRGAQGPPGSSGSRGRSGRPGAPGSKGDRGPAGAQGPQGPSGSIPNCPNPHAI